MNDIIWNGNKAETDKYRLEVKEEVETAVYMNRQPKSEWKYYIYSKETKQLVATDTETNQANAMLAVQIKLYEIKE